MNAFDLNERPASSKESLGIFIFYDEFSSGVTAKRLSDRISKLAGEFREADTEIWKLDSIPVIGPLMNVVARQATSADIIIVAVAGKPRGSAMVRWLNSMSAALRSGGAVPRLLIGLLPKDRASAADFITGLAALADTSGMEFLSRDIGEASEEEFESLGDEVRPYLTEDINAPADVFQVSRP